MPFFGQVVQHQRVDVRNAPQADGATVLFLYSGVVLFDFRSGDGNTVEDDLQFDPPDSDLDETEISGGAGRIGVTITPIDFNSNDAFSVIAVKDPRVFFRPEGRGLRVQARVAVQNAMLFRVAYQLAVHAII